MAFKAQIVILKTEKANNKQINKVVQSNKVIGFCFKIKINKHENHMLWSVAVFLKTILYANMLILRGLMYNESFYQPLFTQMLVKTLFETCKRKPVKAALNKLSMTWKWT